MPQTFTIAPANKNGEFLFIGNVSKVSEELFWMILSDKVQLITKDQPDKYEEVLAQSKTALKGKSLTVIDMRFEIKGKP